MNQKMKWLKKKKPFPTGKVDKKLSSLNKKMASKPYGYKRSDEKNRSMKISGIKDAVKRGEDPRGRYSWWCICKTW